MELKKEEIIQIGGRSYPSSSDLIARCEHDGRWILKDRSIMVPKLLDVRVEIGVQSVLEYVYVEEGNYRRYYSGDCYTVICRLGTLIVAPNFDVIGGGRLHNHPARRRTLLDDTTRTAERPNKFRAFNNMVKPFKHYDNDLIPQEDRKALLERDYHFGVRSLTSKIFEGLNYTYGVELETSSGRLEVEEAEGLNLKCEFDGSLRDDPNQRKEDVLGGEYITGVLTGDAGMYQLHNICNTLTKKCTVNDKCGVHVHVGNLTFTKENIVYMYLLGVQLQNEFFEILPKSRKKNAYCRPIKDLDMHVGALDSPRTPLLYKVVINEYFDKIFKEVSHGKNAPTRESNKLRNHPMGSKCGYDKNTQRYCWLNFVTAMFNTKENGAYTLEFRPHSATLNYTKVKNWVKICMAFVNFAENHQLSIKRGYWIDKHGDQYPINLPTILRATYPRAYCSLMEYVEARKEKFRYDDGHAEATEYEKETTELINLTKSQCVS